MKKLPLSGKHGKGKFTMVDDEDAARLEEMGVSLSLSTRGYVQFSYKSKTWVLHRFLIQPQKKLVVDHIDCNPLNNCKANLRQCTPSQNCANVRKRKNKFKGVSFNKKNQKFVAQIMHEGKYHWLGYFEKETDAARAYNAKAKELFGEFAFLNDVGLAE